ncbi:MAG: hypothetical protein AAB731_00405 [Patescibacteria group bacterium]
MVKKKITKEAVDKLLKEIKRIDYDFQKKLFAIKKEQRAVIEKIIKRIDADKIAEIRKRMK